MAGSVFVGAVLLTLAVLAHVFKRIPKLRTWAYLLAGVCFINGFAQFGVDIAAWVTNMLSPTTSSVLGVGAPVLGVMLGTALVFLMVHSLHPKKGKPAGWHGPVFFFAFAVLASLGGYFADFTGLVDGAVTTVTTQVGG